MGVLYLAGIYNINVTSLIQLKIEEQTSHCFPPKNNKCMSRLSLLTVPTNVIILVKSKYISSQTIICGNNFVLFHTCNRMYLW